MDRRLVEAKAILLTKVGSHSYGINTASSDIDYKGIFIAPKEYYLGLKNIEQKDKGWDENSERFPILNGVQDLVFYELRKYLKLAKDANPNILELLFESTEFYEYIHPRVGRKLLESRELFLSKKIKYSYSGYAYSQIRKIKSHRKWLLNPPTKKPSAEDYGLTDKSALDKSEEKAFITFLWMLIKDRIEYMEEQQELYNLISDRIDYKGVINNNQLPHEFYPYIQNLTKASERYMDILRRTQEYRKDLHYWKSYQSWLKNRNPQRAELEAKCGYDCYSLRTEFLTDNGWKKYHEITAQDRLAQFDLKTQEITFAYYLDRGKYKLESDRVLHEITTPYTKVCITANHKLIAASYSKNIQATKNNSFQLVKFQDLPTKTFFVHSVLKPIQPKISKNKDYLILMTAYVAEGYINMRKNKTIIDAPKALRIEQKIGGKLCSYLDNIQDYTLLKYPINKPKNRHRQQDYQGYLWVNSNKDLLHQLIKDCGTGSSSKSLPFWTIYLNIREKELILEILYAADGTVKYNSNKERRGIVIYTISKQLADSIQLLCLSMGRICNIQGPYPNETNYGSCLIYQVYVPDINKVREAIDLGCKQNYKIVDNETEVCCFTMPEETLITRLDNKVAFHGNSKHAAHCIRLVRMGNEILTTGKVNVDRRNIDAEELLEIRLGNVSYDLVLAEAEKLFTQLDHSYEISTLPYKVDSEKINQLAIELVDEFNF